MTVLLTKFPELRAIVAQLQKIIEIVEPQQIRPAVDSRIFSLEQADDALRLVAQGPIHGKVIIQL